MKAQLVKQLHQLGIYRDPKTKQKLESLKTTQVLEVLNWVNEEMEKATEVAFIPIFASFAFLAALWFLLKKKFWIK